MARLDRIDWNFPRTGTKADSLHTLHWFAGNFIPQIPAALISTLSRPGELVFDPFCGSGTTGIEACRLGRKAVMSDRMSACIAITKAKVALMRNGIDRQMRDAVLSELTFDNLCQSNAIGVNGEGGCPELAAWFAPTTLSQLRYLWQMVCRLEPDAGGVAATLFADVLFTCASTRRSGTRTGLARRHHWGWVADNVKPPIPVDHNAVRMYRDRIAALDVLAATEPVDCEVVQQDARWIGLADESVDLVVTSPPYLGMIDYVHAQRLTYLWMGWSIREERDQEIGARYRRNRRLAYEEYMTQLADSIVEIHRVLRRGGRCGLVIGASQKFPGAASDVLSRFARDLRIAWGPVARLPSRRRVSSRSGTPPTELVCVLMKE